MIGRSTPGLLLKPGGNPWSATVTDDELRTILLDAARKGEGMIQDWIKAGDAKPDAVFAQVFYDPTCPTSQVTPAERIYAILFYGDLERAKSCLSNAIGKAHPTDLTGYENGVLVNQANFCLGNGDFAWGDVARYYSAISAGSGLSVDQDRWLAQRTLELAMNEVHALRKRWIEARRAQGSHGWWNPENVPDPQYVLDLDPAVWGELELAA